MTAPTLHRPPSSHPGPAEVRAALAEVSSGIEHWDRMLDRVYAQALAAGSLDPVETFLAKSWRTVEVARNGVAPAEQHVSQEAFLAHVADRNAA